MSWYKTGTISVTNGSPAVIGASTLWVDAGVLNAGDIVLGPDAKLYEILSIQSNTQLTLASNYLGTTLSGQAYAILPIGLLPSALAVQVKSTLSTANTALASAVLSNTATQGLTTIQQANARANIAALTAADVGFGYVSMSVAGSANVTLTAAQAANEIIDLTGTLTGAISVIVPAQARNFSIANLTTGAFALTVKTAAGTGIVVPQGARMVLECNGTNVVNPQTALAVTAGSIDGVPVGATTPNSGNFSVLQQAGSQAFARSNVLGTVSQSAGVPTGALMEYGSNANGEYVRFADGTQICVSAVLFPGDGTRQEYAEYTWAAAFISSLYTVSGSAVDYGYLVTDIQNSAKSGQGVSKTTTTNSSSITVSEGSGFNIIFIATGRWF